MIAALYPSLTVCGHASPHSLFSLKFSLLEDRGFEEKTTTRVLLLLEGDEIAQTLGSPKDPHAPCGGRHSYSVKFPIQGNLRPARLSSLASSRHTRSG